MKKRRFIVFAIFIVFIIAFALLFTQTACGRVAKQSFGTTHYKDMKVSCEPIEVYEQLGETIMAAATAGTMPAGELRKLYDELEAGMDSYETDYALCYVDYHKDNTDAATLKAYSDASAACTEAESVYKKARLALLDSSYAEKLFAALTEAEKKNIRIQASVMSDEYAEYQEQFLRLVEEYYASFNGELNIDGDTMSFDELYQKYGVARYEEELNRLVAPIYLELVELNNSYAKLCGYSNFSEYAYETQYLRDYTPTEAQALFDSVKKYIAPVVMSMEAENVLLQPCGLSFDDYESELKSFAYSISPSMGAAFDTLLAQGLCHYTDSPNSIASGFTVELPSYSSAAIYNHLAGDYNDIFTMAHELGHFYDIYSNNGFGLAFYDIIEIPSNAAELLCSIYTESFFDSETYALVKADYMKTLLQFLVHGLEYAEFENKVYSSNFTTPEELNRCYSEICASYGDEENAAMGYHWSMKHHMFDLPQYYISYVTSLVPALEVYTTAAEDYEKGAKLYVDIVKSVGECNGIKSDKAGYSDFLECAGMPSPFKEENIKALAAEIKELLQ